MATVAIATVAIMASPVLKEQCPVTAHAPHFDFWTGWDVPNSKRRENRDKDLKILLHPPRSSISV